MSTKPLKPHRSKLAVRLGAALVTSMVVQRGRMQALLKEAQQRGTHFLQFPPSDIPENEKME